MSDIFSQVRNLQQRQNESGTLLEVHDELIPRAEAYLQELKDEYKRSGSEDIMNRHESLATILDDLLETRARIIWDLAYDGAGDVRNMTTCEVELYQQAADISEKLRGDV